MKLIVGLGNPGRAYAHTRHNVGFDTVDILAKRHGVRVTGRQCRSLVGRFEFNGQNVLLVKPQTYMNDSGSAVGQLAGKYKPALEDIIVVCDDIDLPLGALRIRRKGSSGGHKGLRSIIDHLGASDFPRLRIGIGRSGEAIEHVLSRFTSQEREVIDVTLELAADALEAILTDGIEAAMNRFNRRSPTEC